MKIDIHTHTRKTKQGDAPTREIDPAKFRQVVSSTAVRIIAITNHNVFDLDQYNEIVQTVAGDFQVWPGVELDVIADDRRGHLIVIVSPKKAVEFSQVVIEVSTNFTPDSFQISIEKVLEKFDDLHPLYIAHYHQKKPNLLDEDIDYIVNTTAHKNRVLKEVTNAVSAGIFISHGHASIFGSDIKNWGDYRVESESLPDLRLPVESFEQFCLLLQKDQVTINTLLKRKQPEIIIITPFSDGLSIELTVYDDINVFFGSKGTGKSDILSAIASYYSNKGIVCKKFESGKIKLKDEYDLKGKQLKVDLNDYEINYCQKEIESLRSASEVGVSNLSRYLLFFSETLTNKNSQKIKIKDFKELNSRKINNQFQKVLEADNHISEFINFLKESDEIKGVLDSEEIKKLLSILIKASSKLESKGFGLFASARAGQLFNSLINKFKSEISRKAGTPDKPGSTGFREYAFNRIEIDTAAQTILTNITKSLDLRDAYIGDLGDKGQLYCRTELFFQDGTTVDNRFSPLKKINKKPLKEFSRCIKSIKTNSFTDSLFNDIAKLNRVEHVDDIPTILELLLFNRSFVIDGKEYEPSTGEESMILLHRELSEEKDIYILDEPEKSLGNEYINNVIVPLIKEKAKIGKKIFIATHDANIAVRTLPYNSIYRHHDQEGYKTYVGNPFSNSLIGLAKADKELDWKDVSMRTLEGGKDAFGERGQIYGNQ